MNISLLPWRQALQRRRFYQFYGIWLVSITITTLIALLLNSSLNHSLNSEKNRIVTLNKQLNKLPSINNAQIIKLNNILNHKDIISLLMTISKTLPSGCVLSKIAFDEETWTISGITDEVKSVWIFIRQLKKTSSFPSISISQLSQKHHVLFTIRLSNSR